MSSEPRKRLRIPRRVVRYKLLGDPLGPYIVFGLDVVVLPDDIPPHKLPPGIELSWTRLDCKFTPGDISMTPARLRQLFLEFAEAMRWEVHQEK